MKKVISYSLWGDNPKYTVGAIKNCELAEKIYPDWVCRFYIGKSTPKDVINKIIDFKNTEVQIMNDPGNWSGMFWRFYAAVDPEVEIMLSRDTDSRLSERERLAVDEWISSDKGFHIMRDHPYHQIEICGGMWGMKKNCITNSLSGTTFFDLLSNYQKGDFWQTDQNFLKEKVYHLIKDNSMVHDEFFERKPFPSKRINYEFVGQIFDENNITVPEHVNTLKQHLSPILIHHHLGLGDHFVCNGLVRYIYRHECKNITLVVKKNNYETVKALYSDLNIKYMVVDTDSDVDFSGYKYIKIGFEFCNENKWEESFYNQINLDYNTRYEYAFFPRNTERENNLIDKLNIKGEYAFCNTACSEDDYEINIDSKYKKIYLQKLTDNLLDWIGIIENAKEIHTIDTAVFQMIKNLNLKNSKNFYTLRQTKGKGAPYSLDNQDWKIHD